MTIEKALKQLSIYPIPREVIERICIDRGLDCTADYTAEISTTRGLRLAKADVYKWLYTAVVSVSENGVSFNLSTEDKRLYRKLANDIYADEGEETISASKFGYIGNRL